MHNSDLDQANRRAFHAGIFYLLIIAFGVGGAMLVRAPLLDMQDLPGSVANMAASALPFRLSILADLVMALADVALAIVFFHLFRPVSPRLSMAAMIFRLLQAGLIALNLVNLSLAVSSAEQGDVAWTLRFLGAHDAGYALALVFFAVSSAILARLVARQEFLPRIFAPALWLIALLYAVGSVVRIAAPEMTMTIAPIYLLTFVLELSLCLWLLSRGLNVGRSAWRTAPLAAPLVAALLTFGGCASEAPNLPEPGYEGPAITMCCDCACSDDTGVCLNVVTRVSAGESCPCAWRPALSCSRSADRPHRS